MPKSKKENINLPKLVVIIGPTGSGKSKLAIDLAKKFNGEIVVADSRQIYQEMDIGTDKIIIQKNKKSCLEKTKIYQGVPHHLIDLVKPNQEFSLSLYKKLALQTIKKIIKKGKLPFLVGGTGLYVQAIVDNLQIPAVPPDKALRKKLEKLSSDKLFQRLKKLDPETAKKIDPKNKRRLIRALEVCLKTGKPFSQQQKKGPVLFDVLQIGLRLPKKVLHQRINQRVEEMIKLGLIAEVKKLIKKYPINLPAFSGIGYQEIINYLQGKISLEQAKELIKLHTRQYAKRQMTWFKRDERIHWIRTKKEAEKLISAFLNLPTEN